jgi:hypothetical protein
LWGEALLLCLNGSLYPVALAAVIAYLGGPRPLRGAVAFMVGGAIVRVVTGTGIAIAVTQLGLTKVEHPTPSALIDIVLGMCLLIFSAILLQNYRKASAAEPPHVVAEPGPPDHVGEPARHEVQDLQRSWPVSTPLAGTPAWLKLQASVLAGEKEVHSFSIGTLQTVARSDSGASEAADDAGTGRSSTAPMASAAMMRPVAIQNARW